MVVISLCGDSPGSRSSVLGVRREKRVLTCRLDGQEIRKRSGLAEALPVQWIGSQPQLLLESGPEVRRRFIDMGLFHVEQSYLGTLGDFHRILRQRNAAIRLGGASAVRVWNQSMHMAALALNESRQQFVHDLMRRVQALIAPWKPGFSLGYKFRPGWSLDGSLLEQLESKIDLDLKMGYTTIGPQRAELELLADNVNAAKKLSRGQQKILVLALNLALMDYMLESRGVTPVVLCDDLAAELDVANRERVIKAFEARPAQVFLTMVDRGALRGISTDPSMFHVEHGQLS